MSIEAAYHEAAHAVLTARSKLHTLSGVVNIGGYGLGTGFSDAGPSRKKCAANGISESSAPNNAVVVREFVRILCAGYAAECEGKDRGLVLIPDINRSVPDFLEAQRQLRHLGLSEKLNGFHQEALDLVKHYWDDIQMVAAALESRQEIPASEVLEMLHIDA